MITEHQEQMFEQDYDRFVAGGFFYTAKDPAGKWTLVEALKRLREFTMRYVQKHNSGMSSQSAFGIIRDELLAESDPTFKIVPIVVEEDNSSEIARKIADFDAGKISVYQFRLDCKANRELRDAYERHTGLAQLSQGR
jgi:hypothetical protein